MAKTEDKNTEIDDLKKLSPKERLARLKQMEEKKKKEMQETEQMLKETIRQVQVEEVDEKNDDVLTFQTLRDKVKPLNEILEQQQKSLEQEVADAQVPKKEEEQQVQYGIAKEVRGIYEGIQQLGYASQWGQSEKEQFYQFKDRLEELADNYQLSKDLQKQVAVSQNLVDNVRSYIAGGDNQGGSASGMEGYKRKGHKQYFS